MSEKEKPDFATLAAELHAAEEAYLDAEQAESFARSRATEAKNRLNAAQKAFDTACGILKGSAPNDSDWGWKRRDPAFKVVNE